MPGSYGSTPFKWNAAAGYQHIPFTGLYHVGAREYDPRTARWLQRDPIGPSSGDPNVYRYCGNDPINEEDIDGTEGSPKLGSQSVADIAQEVTKLNAWSAFEHYKSGKGSEKTISFDQVDTTFLRAEHFAKISHLIRQGQSGLYNIEDEIAYRCWDLPTWLMLGTITLKVEGELAIDPSGDWRFIGGLSAKPDTYDFNAANRGFYGELSTAIGRATSGKSFRINIVGAKRFVGSDSKVKSVNVHGGEGISDRSRHRF